VQLINKTGSGVLVAGSRSALRSASSGEASAPHAGSDSGTSDCFSADDLQFLQVFASQAATAVATNGTFEEPQTSVPEARSCDFMKMCIGRFFPRQTVAMENDCNAEKTKDKTHNDLLEWPLERRSRRLEHVPSGTGTESPFASEATREMLDAAFHGWELDTITLADLSDNKPLSTLSVYLFERLGLVKCFGLNRKKVVRFFAEIEIGYDTANPYHNRSHAASVLFSSCFSGAITNRACAGSYVLRLDLADPQDRPSAQASSEAEWLQKEVLSAPPGRCCFLQ